MANNQKDLLNYLSERAHELSIAAKSSAAADARRLLSEAEELMAIRSNIINRGAQLLLPLEVRKAA